MLKPNFPSSFRSEEQPGQRYREESQAIASDRAPCPITLRKTKQFFDKKEEDEPNSKTETGKGVKRKKGGEEEASPSGSKAPKGANKEGKTSNKSTKTNKK